jgi:cation transport regulator ChaB
MPYESNEDLPEAIKDSLPAAAQSIFRNTFNSAAAKGADEQSAIKQAWGAVKNAGYQKGSNGNWHKANQQIDLFAKTYDFDAEIFSAGTWNGDKYNEADLQMIVDNFEKLKDRIKPPVKLGHGWKEGQPALGWVKALRVQGKKLIATLSQVPEIVYNAIKQGLYKRLSSEIYLQGTTATGEKLKNVLRAVALLGADIPAVENLEDLTAYMTQNSLLGSFENCRTYEFDTVNNAGDIQLVIYHEESNEGKKQMADDTKKFTEKIAALEAKLKEKDAAINEKESEIKKFREDQEMKDQQQREAEFVEYCEKLVKDGRMLPAERDRLIKEIPTFQYNSEGYLIPFVSFKSYAESHKAVLDTKETGQEGKGDKKKYSSASDELADRADKLAAEKDWDYEKASTFVLKNDPDLAERYKLEDIE